MRPASTGQRPVRDQGEQHPFGRRVQTAALQQIPRRRADAEGSHSVSSIQVSPNGRDFANSRSSAATTRAFAAADATPEDLLAFIRGHWQVEHAHWLRDVIWKGDKCFIWTGSGPQVWSAITNLVFTLFLINGVTSFTKETRRIAYDPRRALQILDPAVLSPG